MEIIFDDIAKYLIEHSYKIATAESCTGGMIASIITGYSGISSVYEYGIISYSNEAKIKILEVSDTTLKKYGAVSEETAIEMVMGLRKLSACDYGIAVTGIAGPLGGSAEKPVGLVYIAVSYPGGVICKRNIFTGDRKMIRTKTVAECFNILKSTFEL